ncbi:hypothetical protein [Eubacterium maltosivorans]|uniref:hypothetical protein n=1 Tax=Eubacterium maltosivorans TaxID=2041044 RepID=UPI00189DD575|nr:hypothetical protein [Eubacterium maltosivorans]
MKILSRNEKEKLYLDQLGLEILIGGLFDKCKNLDELEWVEEQLTDTIELISEEYREALEVEDE